MSMQTPIIFLPGWGFQSCISKEYLPMVTHFIDLPLLEKENELIEHACDRIEAKLPSQPILLIGWSLGGLLQIKLYERHPNHYKALIIITSTPCFRRQNEWPGISKTEQNIFMRKLEQPYEIFFDYYLKLIQGSFQNPKFKTLLRSHIISKDNFSSSKIYQSILFESDLRATFSNIKVPTLLIYGDKDPIIPKKANTYLSKLNPYLTHYQLAEAGHLPFLTHNNETKNVISSFLNGIL